MNNSKKIHINQIKKIYSLCSKLYISDFIVYITMSSPKSDIFYLDPNEEDWKIMHRHYSLHEFSNRKKIINAYKNFYQYVAIGNAMLNKV